MKAKFVQILFEENILGLNIATNGALAVGWELNGGPFQDRQVIMPSEDDINRARLAGAGRPPQPVVKNMWCQSIAWTDPDNEPILITPEICKLQASILDEIFTKQAEDQTADAGKDQAPPQN